MIDSLAQTLASLISDLAPSQLVATQLSKLMHELLAEEEEHPFMTHTVREMLFEGWSLQPYVNILKSLYEQLNNSTDSTLPPLPPLPEDPKFGFFYGVNNNSKTTKPLQHLNRCYLFNVHHAPVLYRETVPIWESLRLNQEPTISTN